MSQTNDDPAVITIECNPIDFEAARAQLEQHGYVLTHEERREGRLILTGERKRCSCDLCLERETRGEQQ